MPAWREFPGHAYRATCVWASHQHRLRDFATSSRLTRGTVRRFVAGETLPDALRALERLRGRGLATTVDALGESVTSAEEARAAADRYLEVIDALAARGLDRNVSLKLTQMGLDVDPILCRENVRRIAARAAEVDAFVRVDMEDHTRTDATLDLVRDLHRDHPNVGVVIQAYLRRSGEDVAALCGEGIRVRLCKGAYDEPPQVAFATRAEVNASFRALLEKLLRDGQAPAFATHDEHMIEHARTAARAMGIEPSRFEFQMLYGVRRDLQERLARDGYGVRVYVPFGTDWYPYFMRRLGERPANVLFLVASILGEGRRRPRRAQTGQPPPSMGG